MSREKVCPACPGLCESDKSLMHSVREFGHLIADINQQKGLSLIGCCFFSQSSKQLERLIHDLEQKQLQEVDVCFFLVEASRLVIWLKAMGVALGIGPAK